MKESDRSLGPGETSFSPNGVAKKGQFPLEILTSKQQREEGRKGLERARRPEVMKAEIRLKSPEGGTDEDLQLYLESFILYWQASTYLIGASKLKEGSSLTQQEAEDAATSNMIKTLMDCGKTEEKAREIALDKVNFSKRLQMLIGVKDFWS